MQHTYFMMNTVGQAVFAVLLRPRGYGEHGLRPAKAGSAIPTGRDFVPRSVPPDSDRDESGGGLNNLSTEQDTGCFSGNISGS